MTLLLDTHLVLWWLANDPRVGAARLIIENAGDDVVVSQASLWEVAIKSASGKLNVDPQAFSRDVEIHGFSWLRIENKQLVRVGSLQRISGHGDPFDRLLIAQAQVEQATLLTTDQTLAEYGSMVRVISSRPVSNETPE
jgi:PIN domain nuclease of toxin-antitoxin system